MNLMVTVRQECSGYGVVDLNSEVQANWKVLVMAVSELVQKELVAEYHAVFCRAS
jgi:hypothetical protein